MDTLNRGGCMDVLSRGGWVNAVSRVLDGLLEWIR